MIEIRLPRGVWRYDPEAPLGPNGGFGAVYLGRDDDEREVAVKRLHLEAAAAAHRELEIANDLVGKAFTHVMPVLDSGQDASSDGYYVVMPRAERDLATYISDSGSLPEPEAAEILLQIATGLGEAAHIVHRDLKPANILWYEGFWRIADYGIARFVEDSTSARTLKRYLSPPFAAPEQWKFDHATPATDVYALGCTAHVLLTKQPPFTGTHEDVERGHLHETAPEIPSISPRLQTLIRMMLRKTPEARVSRARIITELEQIRHTPAPADDSGPRAILAAAAADHEYARSEAEARRARDRAWRQARAQKRKDLGTDAESILREICDQLAASVSHIPNASVLVNGTLVGIKVAGARLELDGIQYPYDEDAFVRSKWDVIVGTFIGVSQAATSTDARSASLWYTRQNSPENEYRWYEVGYMGNPLFGYRFPNQPHFATPEQADGAHARDATEVQVAYGPVPIDGEDAEGFCERWMHILAAAARGNLDKLHKGLIAPGDGY